MGEGCAGWAMREYPKVGCSGHGKRARVGSVGKHGKGASCLLLSLLHWQ